LFQWKMGCEGMVWSADGEPLQGLSKCFRRVVVAIITN
jgi:hypothetical protein